MYRALYPFQKTHPTSLSFAQGDVFLSLPGARSDKNWHFVLDQKGIKGFVPRNYVDKEEKQPNKDEYDKLLENTREAVLSQRMGEKDRAELLVIIENLKKSFKSDNTNNSQQGCPATEKLPLPTASINGGGGEKESSSCIPKAPSPRPDSLSSNEEIKGKHNLHNFFDKFRVLSTSKNTLGYEYSFYVS